VKKIIVSALAAIVAVSASAAMAQPSHQHVNLDWKIEELGANGWQVLSSGSTTGLVPKKGKWSNPMGFEATVQKPYLSGIGTRDLAGKPWKTPVESVAEYGSKLKVQFKAGEGELPVKVQFDDVKLVGKHDGFDRFSLGDGTTIQLANKNHAVLKGKNTVKPGEWAYPLSNLDGYNNYRVAIKLTPAT